MKIFILCQNSFLRCLSNSSGNFSCVKLKSMCKIVQWKEYKRTHKMCAALKIAKMLTAVSLVNQT